MRRGVELVLRFLALIQGMGAEKVAERTVEIAAKEKGGTLSGLEGLKDAMGRMGLSAFVVYKRDPHMNEYVHEHFDPIEYLTGFTGSNATLLVRKNAALLFTDSRYFIQAGQEIDESKVLLAKIGHDKSLKETILDFPGGSRVGINPEFVCRKERMEKFAEEAKAKGIEIVWVEEDLVGAVWRERPVLEAKGLEPMEHSMLTEDAKLAMVRNAMTMCSGLILTAMDEIAWMLNLRGRDIPMSRLFYAFMYVGKDGTEGEATVVLFTDNCKTEKDAALVKAPVEVRPYNSFYEFIGKLEGQELGVSAFMNNKVSMILGEKNKLVEVDIVERMKAIKTPDEVAGFELSNIKDAVSLCKLFGSIQKDLDESEGEKEVGELDVADRLLALKKEHEDFIIPSFSTISAYGKNGAIVHYNPKNNQTKLGKDSLFLIDSGSQYGTGTTDITRTVCFGRPTEEQRKDYTRVLKGNMMLELVRFPEETTGASVDALVREPLWRAGKDFAHGTGHGVGFGLNVHEGPHAISSFSREQLKPGMVVTNEPGLYLEGKYGIRHENLMVVERDTVFGGFLKLRNLTPVPVHIDLIDLSILTDEEITHLNAESSRIRKTLAPFLAGDQLALSWLEKNTREVRKMAE